MFQTYTDQTRSFECEERDQQSQNNEECLKDKVQSKLKTKFNVHVCEIQHSMRQGNSLYSSGFHGLVLYS